MTQQDRDSLWGHPPPLDTKTDAVIDMCLIGLFCSGVLFWVWVFWLCLRWALT